MPRRFVSGTATCALAALLGACSGVDPGGGSASGNITTPPPVAGTGWASRSVAFDPSLAQLFLSSGEFRASDANCSYFGCASSGPAAGNQSRAFELHNVHLAHSAGLTGAGQLVAVVDSGFRLSHQEFTGKTLYQTGSLPLANHGTHVASLIAGVKDGRGMHGVAPGADLHLTAINPTGAATLDMANVTAGTLAAAQRGAVAQNNSWGFEVSASSLKAHLDANPGATTAQGLAGTIGYNAGDWQSYLNALDAFQQGGVVVWALSNNEAMLSGDAMATLPYFEPRLREAWIAAANGYFEVDGGGDVTRALRLSAACGLAAQFCIAGDGTTTAASAASDTSYASGTGTSYVAPQVAASVALLAEAFPDLAPAEWAKRLLASADNSWFAALGVAAAGTVDFGNGVTHGYSDEWGHGLLDLEAALSPIGSVAVLDGGNVTTSGRMALDETPIATPSSFGDGLANALRGEDMAVFDALNRSFEIDAASLVQPQVTSLMPDLMAQVSLPPGADGRRHVAALGPAPRLASGTQMHMTRDLDGLLNGGGTAGGNGSMLSLAGDALAVTSTHQLGGMTVTGYGFAGNHQSATGGAITGGGVTVAVPAGAGLLSLGVSEAAEAGGMLGLTGNQAFDFGSGSTISALNVGFEQNLSPALQAFGRFEYGALTPQGMGGGLVASASDIRFAGLEIGAVASGVMTADDTLTVSLGQPMRVESGTVGLQVPVGRTADGEIQHRDVQAGLAPSGRQLDLGLTYALTLPNQAAVKLGVEYAIDAGHVDNASEFGIAAALRQSF